MTSPDPDDIACKELVELVTAYLEGALQRRDRTRLEMHLCLCGGCRAYVDQMRATVRVAAHAGPGRVAPADRRRLAELFRDWKRSGGEV